MFSRYYTRNGKVAEIKGISEYFQFGPVTIYNGNVEGKNITWDEYGRYKMNQLFGDQLPHQLDLVAFDEEIIRDPGIYYVVFKR
jgi:hypothetical protein